MKLSARYFYLPNFINFYCFLMDFTNKTNKLLAFTYRFKTLLRHSKIEEWGTKLSLKPSQTAHHNILGAEIMRFWISCHDHRTNMWNLKTTKTRTPSHLCLFIGVFICLFQMKLPSRSHEAIIRARWRWRIDERLKTYFFTLKGEIKPRNEALRVWDNPAAWQARPSLRL